MDAQQYAVRARTQQARELYERCGLDRTGETKPPSASPTTFSDCAVLWDGAALAYRVAGALASDGYLTEAAGYAAQGAVPSEAAASCDASASGEIIEV